MVREYLDSLEPWKERALIGGGVGLLLCLYIPINHYTADLQGAVPETWVDRAVPFDPRWVAIYELFYLFMLLPVVLPSDRSAFRRIVGAYALTGLVSFVVFLVYPVHFIERPTITSTETFGEWVLAMTHRIDTPSNCLPSLHVSLALLAALSAWSLDRKVGLLALPMAVVIGLSTLFVKQHFWWDVVTGWGLGLASWFLLVRGAVRPGTDPDRRWLVRLVVAQAVLGLGALLLHRLST